MARVTLAPFIHSISGKVGNLEFRTLKSGRTVVRARRETDYQTEHIPSAKERAQRRRFGIVSSVVSEIQHGYARVDEAAHDRKRIWQKVSYLYGKYYESIEDDKALRAMILRVYNVGGEQAPDKTPI